MVDADSWALSIPPDEPDEPATTVSRSTWFALSSTVASYEANVRGIAMEELKKEATSEERYLSFRDWLAAEPAEVPQT